jgi:hypothetical protein
MRLSVSRKSKLAFLGNDHSTRDHFQGIHSTGAGGVSGVAVPSAGVVVSPGVVAAGSVAGAGASFLQPSEKQLTHATMRVNAINFFIFFFLCVKTF